MKQIIKRNEEPQPLIDHRIKSAGLNYSWATFQKPEKPAYKEYLLKEQGYICAYCMQRISSSSMKIEHIKPRHECTEEEKLNNKNMLAVCLGITDAQIHCDTKRGNLKPSRQHLYLEPTKEDPTCEQQTYFLNGEIFSVPKNTLIEEDINKKLNLNCSALKTLRNAAEQGFIDGLIHMAIDGEFHWDNDLLNAELTSLLQTGISLENRIFNEFCLIEMNVLTQKIEFNKNLG